MTRHISLSSNTTYRNIFFKTHNKLCINGFIIVRQNNKVKQILHDIILRKYYFNGAYAGGYNNSALKAIRERRRGYFSTPSLSKNCATVIHFGCSISRLRKSLSPVRIISTSDTMAAFNIGWSFASRISFSALSTAGINS